MQDAKTGGSRWVPDIREDEITEFQEQNGDETATYKAVNVHPIISRVLDKLAFFRTHVSAVWYNKLANKTVKDKLDEIDTSISSLNSRFHSINSSNHFEFTDNQAQYTGISATIPANSYYAITGKAEWNVAMAIWVGIASSSTLVTSQYTEGTATQAVASCSMCGYTDAEMVLYLWAQYSGAGTNRCMITGFYISA